MRLPELFVSRMQELLGLEYEDFMASFDEPRHYGLRINTLKIPVEEFKKISPFQLEPVPWAGEGFYISGDDRPAKHPFYHAGLYYIQEPSAMLTVAVLDPKPGDRVLDLCAAPGGKSTQIAARLAGQGLLVSNDVNQERTKSLVRNLEMCGVTNYVVLNEVPARLVPRFRGYFDKIVIDAPCSGEGMFRKDLFAVKSWGEFSIDKCTAMQRSILNTVSPMLKPGGYVVYSTCTFNPQENEGMIEYLVRQSPELEVVEIQGIPGLSPGRPEWADSGEHLRRAGRLWPHKIKGEGHFVALLRKTDGDEESVPEYVPPAPSPQALRDFLAFTEENLAIEIAGPLLQKFHRLYRVPPGLPSLDGLKVVRPGWSLGELHKDRFKPGGPMAVGLKKEDARRVMDFAADSEEVVRYLKGETVEVTGEYGWNLVCVAGYPLGWGKQLKDRFNNYYPSGWRRID